MLNCDYSDISDSNSQKYLENHIANRGRKHGEESERWSQDLVFKTAVRNSQCILGSAHRGERRKISFFQKDITLRNKHVVTLQIYWKTIERDLILCLQRTYRELKALEIQSHKRSIQKYIHRTEKKSTFSSQVTSCCIEWKMAAVYCQLGNLILPDQYHHLHSTKNH